MVGLSIAAVVITLLVATSIVWGTLRAGISPMPSSRKAIAEMLHLAPDDVAGHIYELGSGWGLLALQLSKKYPNAQVTGIEISWAPYLLSRIVNYVLGGRNLRFIRGDFRTVPLSSSSLIVCYLFPEGMAQLAKQLEGQLSNDTVVISNTFRMPGWTPTTVSELNDLYRSRIYRYDVVAEGAWQNNDLTQASPRSVSDGLQP